MINVTPLTIERPMNKGYFPDQHVAQKIVTDMRNYIDRTYSYASLYEFSGITMGYMKCQGCGNHKACEDIVPTYGRIVFKLKDK